MKMLSPDVALEELLLRCPERVSQVFVQYLQNIPSGELKRAMQHAVGGKHLRSALIYATGSIFNAPWEYLDLPATAIELIHTYSLIHDDLPAMDNADLRRGKPSCHRLFGEDMAILGGDAFHTLAMHILATHPSNIKNEKRLQMITTLTQACGPNGMIAGQALDMRALNDTKISTQLLLDIYRLKTGALFSASVEMARIATGDEDEMHANALKTFSDNIGLAFQIQDDIFDIESDPVTLGKGKAMDSQNQKLTYPRLFGVREANRKVETCYQSALAAIDYLGTNAQLLRDLTARILQREN